ncbi:hypothetical protein AAHA92_17639 [Salvia divinorum]|uniref:Uncharacterized protein n=1 Tax=Salvia divinorum TaxID=28513 RepID=A0ABD1GZW3_SALDI
MTFRGPPIATQTLEVADQILKKYQKESHNDVEREQSHVGGEEKAKFVKDLHVQVQERIRRREKQVAHRVNKGCKKVVF